VRPKARLLRTRRTVRPGYVKREARAIVRRRQSLLFIRT
jgi:hypothetical protein